MANDTALALDRIRLEREELELEDLRERVGKQRLAKEERRLDKERMRADQEANERKRTANQAICLHRKGGKDQKAMLHGNDSNYSVVTNTYPTGQREVMCQRCEKVWAEPPAALRKMDPKAFRDQMREFETALNWPTDNAPSGRQIFRIERVA